MADGMVAIVENAPTDQAAINQLARSIILYSLVDPAPPARSNFIVEAQLGTWGSVREFLDCNALNSASTPYFPARNTEPVMAPNFGTNIIGSGKCSNVSGLFEEPFIGAPKIVQFITQDCQAYFNNPTQQSKCKQMANNIYAVLVASPNKNMTHKMHLTADIVTVYIFNDPMPPLRKKFVQNATLGTWGTLEELLNCTKMATPSQTPSQSDCSDIKRLVTPLVQGANPPIVYYLKEDCYLHFSDDSKQIQPCLMMVDGIDAIISTTTSVNTIPSKVLNWMVSYLSNGSFVKRESFIKSARLGKWGTLMQFINCASATPTYPSNCSQADRLFIPRNNSPLVKYLIEDCENCFNNSDQSVELGQCIEMVMGINVIVVSSTNDHVYSTIRQIHRWINSPTEAGFDGRKKFLQNATLGKWRTLKELFKCAVESPTPTTTTAITTTPSPTTTSTPTSTATPTTTASSHRGNCSTIAQLFKPATPGGPPRIAKYLNTDCERAFVNASEIGQLSKCLDMVDGLAVILSFSSSQQQLPLRVKHWIMAYINRDPNPPMRQKFVANAKLEKWGTLKQFLTCAGELPISTTPVPTTTTPSTTTNKCSELAPLLNSPVQGSVAPIVYDIRLDCASCFSESTEPQKYASCMTMANGVDAIVTSSVQKSEIPMEVRRWLLRYKLNDPSPPTRESFINRAPLGKWGTLKQFIDCSEKSTTTTSTTATITTASTTAFDRCKTVVEQVTSRQGELPPLSKAIQSAGNSSKLPLHKLLLMALANRIQIALNHAQPGHLVQAAKGILDAMISANPYLKNQLESIQIGHWGTVGDFLNCPS